MGLYAEWKEIASKSRNQMEYDEFWRVYLEKETEIYEVILEKHSEFISGSLKELAGKFEIDTTTFSGFLDGINTSLVELIDLDKIDEDTEIKLELDFDKLYHNMLDAKAEWLYNLSQWDPILTTERRHEIKKEYNRSKTAISNKVGRNDPCPCGSGKKYKKCCGA
jgi:hypothetical protein